MTLPLVHGSDSADKRLKELDLSVKVFHRSLDYGHAETALCTGNDAPSFAGMTMYSRTGRRLRELLIPHGWEAQSPRSQMRVVNPATGITVIHSLGSADTGDPRPEAMPTQQHPKGSMTDDAVKDNTRPRQPTLFDDLFDETVKPAERKDDSWFYLYRPDGIRIRSELSYPDDIVDGRVVSWVERIILPELEIDPELIIDEEDDGGFEFTIHRRTS